jgi:hypothetical protein
MRSALENREDSLLDPARFAQAIRGLAYDAHRTLTHSPSPMALRKLSRRIELLGSALGDRREGPLGTWLDNLGQEVRSAAVHRAASSRPMCICV